MTGVMVDGHRRVRMNPRRAAACAKGMRNPVAHHEEFLELVFALAGPGFQRSYDRFVADPGGRRLLAERPDIVEVLADDERMAACPAGSLGHAYVDFMAQNRLDASLYDNTHHDLPAIGARLGWDDDFAYVVHRGIALHDLFHVLGGYGPDVGGELGVVAFTHGQVEGWITGATRATLLALPLGVPRRDRLRYWREAVERGRGASMLFAAPYEELFDLPLDEVRTRLGIAAESDAHPHGHMYSTYQFGTGEQRQMDQAYERYRYRPDRSMTAPTPTGSLTGRTVLVTGGNGGIGLGMASACGLAGAQVVVWGRDEAKNDAALDRLSSEGTSAHAFVCDVGDPAAIADTFVRSVEAAGGRIDSVFANAGTTGAGVSFLDVTLEEWHRVLRINLDGVMLTMQAAARHMVEQGGGGALVAVSSTSAIHGAAGNEAYGAAKSALLGLTRALAVGLARHEIRVNALLPGWTITELAGPAYAWDRFREVTTSRTPARRWADPDEMGPAAVFLADPTTTFHTGDTVVVDGGYTVF